jgi:hypothetical protein
MAQIFISYSRKDGEFVHWLDQELTRRGREVDWEGIQSGLLATGEKLPENW